MFRKYAIYHNLIDFTILLNQSSLIFFYLLAFSNYAYFNVQVYVIDIMFVI